MRALAALIGAVLALTTLVVMPSNSAEAARSDQATYRLKVITQNIAGGAMFAGKAAALSRVEAEVRRQRPDVVMLQEVCASQVAGLRLRWLGWQIHFTTSRKDDEQCPSSLGAPAASGELLASPWPMSRVTTTKLRPKAKHQPPRTGHLTCADLQISGFASDAVTACVVHLRPRRKNAEYRKRQVTTIRWRFNKVIERSRTEVIVAGDFNATPGRRELDGLYRIRRDGTRTPHGRFIEGDQYDQRYYAHAARVSGARCSARGCRSGQATFRDRHRKRSGYRYKLDYVFWSQNRVRDTTVSAECRRSDSDHCLYRSQALVRLRRS